LPAASVTRATLPGHAGAGRDDACARPASAGKARVTCPVAARAAPPAP